MKHRTGKKPNKKKRGMEDEKKDVESCRSSLFVRGFVYGHGGMCRKRK
jgi:hypothetical protein